MKILITGSTGFIAQSLVPILSAKGHSLFLCTEQPRKAEKLYQGRAEVVTTETLSQHNYDCVMNLAGAGIADRPWTKKRVDEIFSSRIDYTKRLLNKLSQCAQPPQLLLQASAIGYYGFWQEEVLDEDSSFHQGLVHDLCAQWESVAQDSFIEKVCCLRFGVVLGKHGGALKKMLLPYKLGLGGAIGDGEQWVSWVAIDDLISLVLALLDNKFFYPVINVCAPHPIRQKDFAATLSAALSRPCFFKTPESVIRFLLKDGADLLLKSQRVISKRLAEADFEFGYETLEKALKKILNGG